MARLFKPPHGVPHSVCDPRGGVGCDGGAAGAPVFFGRGGAGAFLVWRRCEAQYLGWGRDPCVPKGCAGGGGAAGECVFRERSPRRGSSGFLLRRRRS
jgi:hypothetical protein